MDDEDDGSATWNKLVTLILVVGSIIVLLVLLFMVFLMPSLQQ